ncbi:hypothetical protein LAZ67_3003726 [Cordylochernes scorpioides]|uniref:CCHC-type domain-containing protein n=1 Tax=Cordylochernes scorpioides TaxID=51811 RepID=A0ABY6K8R3_9ARAC|nr:hypothetical protein LAZ67_3003726 [Cordylochernes scorpioides]
MSLEATNLVWAGSPHRAEHEPARLGSESEAVADLSAENHFQGEDSRMADASVNYANLPIDRSHANFAAACIADVTPLTSGALAAATNWAEQMEAAESGEDSFTVVKHKRRRRESPNRPVEQRSSGVAASRRTGATPRRRPTAGGATVVQEIRATRADIADARVQQRSSTEDNCVFVEHCPDFGYTHYLQAVEELVGGAGNVLQVMKMDGHMLVGLSTKALAERLLRDGLEIGHTHLRAFPFKKRAERITVANLPFFVDDAAVIEALRPYSDVTSIAPIRLRAGKIPTRVVIRNKGNVLSAFISYGVKCSRCGRQGHRRANCPINPGRASNNGQPQPAPLPPGASRLRVPWALAPAGSQHPEPPPARPDLVAPLGPLPAQKTLGPAAPTPDVEMSIVEETFASSTPSEKNATRVDLDAFIEGHPSVSFAETDALGLGREKVLDLLSSRTKAQRKGPLLSPPQCDALAGLIRQILDLRPGAASNLYKVLGQVKAELRTTPAAVSPTPPLPAPRPAEPTPPAPHGKMTTPAMATSPSPLFQVEKDLTSKRWDEAADIIYKLCNERYSGPLTDLGITEGDITDAVIYPEDREPLLRTCSTQKKNLITEIISAAIERARDSDPFVREGLYALRRMLGSESEAVADLSAENHFQGEDSRMADASANYANLPIDRSHANFAAACIADVTPLTSGALAAATNWAEQMEAAESGEDSFTVVKHKRRRRESPNRPVEQRSSGVAASRRTGATPRRRPTAGGATVVQEIRATRADIADARVQQRSSTEDNCVFVEHCPDFGYTHYLQAVEELVGGAGNVLQVMKMDGHMLVGLSTKALAERLLRDGLEIGHTHLRAFPFKKRAERITVANLPFFVDDAAVIEALRPYGDVTSIAPIRLRAGRYSFTDGRREVFILLKEGFTLEKIPTRVVIRNKGNVLSAFISYGVKCSRCGRQGHRRANCPINPGRASNNGQPQPAPLPPGASSTVSRQQSRPTPAAPALPMEETPSAPPPVTPAPPLQAPEGPVGPRPAGSQHPEPPPARPDLVAPLGPLPAQKTLGPAAPTPDVEMSIVEETFASSTPSEKNATRVDLDAFIEGHPSVSFAETDALGLGREKVLDLLSSRTKAQRKGPLLSPPQCDALAGLIRQILDLRPGAASNLYKVLGQVKAELRTTPAAVSPTPPLPAPRPAEPTPPAPHGKMTTPAMATSPSPLFQVEEDLTSKRWDEAADIIYKLCNERYSGPLTDLGITEGDITDAVIYPEDREPLLRTCSTQKKNLITEIISAAIERARDSDPFVREGLYALRRMLGSESEAVADLSAENHFQGEDSRMADASANYANLPIDRSHANFAAACIADVTPLTSGALAAATNWAEQMEAAESGEDSFTVVKHKRRRRESPNRPVEQRSSGVAASRRTGATPRRRPTAGGATVVQEIRATRADIADARVQQRSSTEDNCVFVEHCPDFGYTHYLQAVEELVGGAGNVLQVMKMDGHMLVGLSTKALAERLLRDGLEIGHTHLRAFPFKKRAERITVANLPFFVDDAAVIEALRPYGDVTSIAPIRLRAGRYTFTDGRREVFILLKEGFTLEKIPTRVVIRNKGNVLSAFISYGVKCSRCGRQGHRRANCPINPGRASNNGQPQPAPLPPGASSTVSRQQSRPTPAAPALPMEETPSAPPPVTPAPPLQAPEGPVGPRPAGSQHPEPPPARPDLVAPLGPLPAQKTLGPAAPTPDVEMSIVEETFASSTPSEKNATRVDLDAFIEGHPSVSFAETDALGLGREKVLDLLSSRTKAQRKGPLLSPPQCDALAGLIRQILDLRPGAASNLYKVLGQVKAELRTTPAAVSPTPPLPAPRPAEPTPPAPHGKMTTPAMATSSSPLFQVEEDLTSKRWDEAADIIYKLCNERYSGPLTDLGITEGDITDAVIYPEDREPLFRTCSTQKKNLITEIISAAIERARDSDPFVREGLYALRRMLGSESEAVADLSAENHFQGEDSRMADASANYANLPIDRSHANFAAACIADVTPLTSGALAAATNWAEQMEAAESGEDSFTVVKHKRRRRESPNRPVEQRSSGVAASRRTGATPRRRPTAGGATVVQEIRATRADIADARVQQRSSTEDNCVFVEHCPDFGYTHYLQAVEELVGGAGNVLQVMKMDGHMLVGLSTKALAERLLRDGLEIGHTHLRAFPFKKRAERITVANLPFFVDDAAVIEALRPYGDVTSIAPIRLRAGRYTFTDGRREVFILLKEGFTLEKIPTRVVIRNKGNVLSAFISYGVKCSRCGRQGHRRANCPINPGRASNNGQPQPAPLPPGASSTVSRQQSRPTPAAPALPMEETPSAPPPVTPAPPLQAPEGPVGPRPAGSQHPEPPPARPDLVAPLGPLPAQKTLGPAAPTPDVEMSIVEETFASSTPSEKNATRVDLDAFIEGHPSVSFAETDALGLGREKVLDLLSSRTKAQRKGPLLSPPQCDALAGLIRQILDLRPGAASNLYKVLGQVKAELRTTPAAVSPTPPLPAPRPAEPTPPAPHGKMTTPAMATSSSPLFQVEEDLTSKRWDEAADIIYKLCNERYSGPLTDLGITEGDITDAVIYPEDREPLFRTCSTQKKNLITEIISAAIERARDSDPFVREGLYALRRMLLP